MPTQHIARTRFAALAQIDAAAGVIRRVAVITEGPALGHGMMIDRTTLEQVRAAAGTYSGGLKVKLDHSGGVGDIVGYLRDFAIDGNKLTADLHLLQTAPSRSYVLELAATIPDTFGLSISFSGVSEEKGGIRYARCSEIYSCDLVSEPAANPGGLFQAKPSFDDPGKGKGDKPPYTTTSKVMDNEILSQVGKLIDDKIAAALSAFDAKFAELKKTDEAACARIDEVSKLSAEAADKAAIAAVKEFSKTLGQPAAGAAAPSAPSTPPAVAKFEDIVKAHSAYAKSKTQALGESIAKYPAEYADYRRRCESGEIVLF